MKKAGLIMLIIPVFLLSVQNSYGQEEVWFKKYMVQSGWHGLYYGIALDIIFDIKGPAAAGLPVIAAGGSVLVPLLFNANKSIDYNTFVLTGHGKSLGWFHGLSLSTLMFGEDVFSDNNDKITVGLGALSSIGGGILGRRLARSHDWSEGRVEMYRHYGWVMPFTGFSLATAFSDEPRVFGASVLAGGAIGYFLGGKIDDWNNYTRGEVRAMQTLASLNMALGYFIMVDRGRFYNSSEDEIELGLNRKDLLFPALGALTGTAIGHFYTRNLGFTPQQGMLTAYSAAGGVVVGLGVALLVNSDSYTPYYLIPYATGLASYITSVEILRHKSSSYSLLNGRKKDYFHVNFMPYNLFLNEKIAANGNIINGRYTGLQPLFSASVSF